MGSPLAYPMGDALIVYVYSNAGTIKQKLSLIEYVQTLAAAQLDGRPPSAPTVALKAKNDALGRDIEALWTLYEPALDLSPFHFQKRAVFSMVLRRLMQAALTIVEKGKMLDSRYMEAGRFRTPTVGGGR